MLNLILNPNNPQYLIGLLLIGGAIALKYCYDIYILLPQTRWGRQNKEK